MSIIRVTLMGIDQPISAQEPGRTRVTAYTEQRLYPQRGLAGRQPTTVDHDPRQIVEIATIREKIMKSPPLDQALERTYQGTFFPALLLYSGWWERRRGTHLADEIVWGDELQRWLFTGFEQWGPSWDLNPDKAVESRYLFGQIGGEGDEADSLTVIVGPEKSRDLREQLARHASPFKVLVTGILCHRNHLRDVSGLKSQVESWGESFDYCLVAYDDVATHQAVPCGAPELYSGYLWKCVLPKERSKFAPSSDPAVTVLEPPNLNDVFFLWEHTNFASHDAVQYNLDSLLQKERYLQSRVGDLILVQKSCDLVDGDPALPKEAFYDFIAETSAP